jgi:hypothetical protein
VQNPGEQKDINARACQPTQALVVSPADVQVAVQEWMQKSQDHVVEPGEKLEAKLVENKEVQDKVEIKNEEKAQDEEVLEDDKDVDDWEFVDNF